MSQTIRIATFNLENLDDKPNQQPSLDQRIALMRPQLERIDADILCLQEVHGQEQSNQPRQLLALNKLLETTQYTSYNMLSTMTSNNAQVYDVRNLVILSRFNIIEHHQYRNDFIEPPEYKKVTDNQNIDAQEVRWERPFLTAKIQLDQNVYLTIINAHLKSRLPTTIQGQMLNRFSWKSASGWAEGAFLSAMKRVGQAMEIRIYIDQLFDQDKKALIMVCGDFNAEAEEVPVEAITGAVENTGNAALSNRVLISCENSVPESLRYSLFHRGKGRMIDHLLISRKLLAHYRKTAIHNENLHDESIAYSTDKKYPESDHAPVVAEFEF